jgi:predicted enzyme related to lactoylglutathione lyase
MNARWLLPIFVASLVLLNWGRWSEWDIAGFRLYVTHPIMQTTLYDFAWVLGILAFFIHQDAKKHGLRYWYIFPTFPFMPAVGLLMYLSFRQRKLRGGAMGSGTGLSRIHQISMRVHDVDRAVRFYRDTLGLAFLFAAPPRLAFFDCNGVRLMLSTPEPEFDHPGSVVYFAVDDIRHMHDVLVSRGVVFRTEPHKIATLADREVWLADFLDSEGNTLALMSEPKVSHSATA